MARRSRMSRASENLVRSATSRPQTRSLTAGLCIGPQPRSVAGRQGPGRAGRGPQPGGRRTRHLGAWPPPPAPSKASSSGGSWWSRWRGKYVTWLTESLTQGRRLVISKGPIRHHSSGLLAARRCGIKQVGIPRRRWSTRASPMPQIPSQPQGHSPLRFRVAAPDLKESRATAHAGTATGVERPVRCGQSMSDPA